MEFRDFMHHRFFKGVVKDFFVLYFADLGILKNWGGATRRQRRTAAAGGIETNVVSLETKMKSGTTNLQFYKVYC